MRDRFRGVRKGEPRRSMRYFYIDGTYPEVKRTIMQLTLAEVAVLLGSPVEDPEQYYLNKGYTVIADGNVFRVAVYKHDFKWWLIELPIGAPIVDAQDRYREDD